MREVNVTVSSITFNDGTEIEIGNNDIVVIVGPNNSGKSTSLKDIKSILSNDNGIVISAVKLKKKGTNESLRNWFSSHFQRQKQGNRFQYRAMGSSVWEHSIENDWKQEANLGNLSNAFCKYVKTEDRLISSNPVQNIDLVEEPPTKPLHVVFANNEIEKTLATSFKQAFGEPLILNRWAGSKLRFQTCKKPNKQEWTPEFLEELKAEPNLEDQGDGMRSFVGGLLESTATFHQIVLFDEPEAFLHPPQARLMGRILARDKKKDKQLFIATHSIDLLKGLIDAGSENVRVIRIKRNENDINPASELSPKDIKDLWHDSLLRSSNILNGLFHKAVVVCEGDADSRFYSSLIDAIYDDDLDKEKPDLMFTHCGGKSKMPIIISALKEVDVPVLAIADFDVLRNKADLEGILNALREDFTKISSEWKAIKNCLDQKSPPLSINQVKQEIMSLINSENSNYLSDEISTAINRKLKSVSAWSQAKESGKNALPSGHIRQQYNKLVDFLNKAGLFIVECGELEKFVPSIGNHGPKWLNEVLEKDLLVDEELSDARNFVKKIIATLG